MNDEPRMLSGRYRLGRLLGHGGMADVYLAEDTRLHRTVAVKVLRSDLARDENFQERFRREAQSAAGLNHPSIVAVHDTGEEHGVDVAGHPTTIPYIVMEYVQGHTLRPYISEEEPMGVGRAAEIMAGVLSALEYSHQSGIVHRDIKPGNIMITPTGAVKVMDFGIARAMADATSAMTQTQAVMGTAQYLSPEQARGQLVDARSDIYSAACVLYELLTGRPPFAGESPISIAYQHVREAPVPPSTYNPKISPELDAVVLTGLAKKTDDRYSSAVEFSRDLAAVASGHAPRLAGPTAAGLAAASASDGDKTTVLSPVDETEALPATVGAGVAGAGAGAGAAALAARRDPSPLDDMGGDEVEDRPRRKQPVWLWVLVILALVAAMATALAIWRPWDDGPQEPTTIAVPDVVTASQDKARSTLKDAGLDPSFTEKASNDVPEGEVIATDPEAGKRVMPGSTVAVTVSSGPAAVTVPDLAGKSTEDAQKALQDLGLKYSVEGEEDSTEVDAGKITRSEPASGTTAHPGDEVQVWLASGKVPLPDVVGTPIDDAESTLKGQGLKVDTTERESADKSPGTVLEQTPTGGDGETVKAGSTIHLVVAREAGPDTMPNLTGRSQAEAEKALKELGFGVEIKHENSDSVAEGNVIRTDPGANEDISKGATVTLYISDGPKSQPTEDPTTETPTESPSDSSSPTDSPSTTTETSTDPGKGDGDGNGNGNGNGNGKGNGGD